MAKVLVTGGAGFIGSHVVDACLGAGHRVTVVDNLSSGSRGNLNPEARLVEMDIRSQELARVFEEGAPDFVLHFAAQIDVRKSLDTPVFDAETNIGGTINILENCVRQKVGKFIYASTGGAIYGEPEALPASESQRPDPLCHYGASKYGAEVYTRLYQKLYGLHSTILRFPNVYGPRQSPHGEAGVCSILAGLMLEAKAPTLYGFGEPVRDYVYVGDIARASMLALGKGDGETLNLGSGEGTTVRRLFDILQELTAFKGEPILKPTRPGEVNRIYITGGRALEVLGWRPEVSLREGLAETVAFIKANA